MKRWIRTVSLALLLLLCFFCGRSGIAPLTAEQAILVSYARAVRDDRGAQRQAFVADTGFYTAEAWGRVPLITGYYDYHRPLYNRRVWNVYISINERHRYANVYIDAQTGQYLGYARWSD
ncbi:MAG: hypothetical protein PHD32_11060 [Eubacteriales bacterium]|nr:hypothetical protein [Eubacteriales bacterium]